MHYFMLDLKRLSTNKKVIFAIIIMLLIAIFDPITVSIQISKYISLGEDMGKNPFQYWMLMNSVSWGNNVYNLMFWIIAVLFTGLIAHEDKKTSMYIYQIIRGRKTAYILSKVISTGLFSLVLMLLILEINVLMTHLLFTETNVMTKYYDYLVPHEGHFIYKSFLSNQMNMIQIYTLLNAFAISLFTVFSQCINMLIPVTNTYVSLLLPIIILYIITFVFDSQPALFQYNIRMILQPMAASAMSTFTTWKHVLIVFAGWALINSTLIFGVFIRSRECYE